ncbi:hypothetical protein [Limnospira platensis]|uniref:hypothetical protein n=1 Tax=Limnospira platensis TaxID=118562 RepID=UPI003D6FCB66
MRNRLKLLCLIFVLGAPMPMAWAMLHWKIGIPDHKVAHGNLDHDRPILSQWPIGQLPDQSQWWLVWSTHETCDDVCLAEADKWWRLHRALGRQAERVLRLRIGSDTDVLPGEIAVFWEGKAPDWHEAYRVWLVDPQGHIVTEYPAQVDARSVHKDLERLLKRNPEK